METATGVEHLDIPIDDLEQARVLSFEDIKNQEQLVAHYIRRAGTRLDQPTCYGRFYSAQN